MTNKPNPHLDLPETGAPTPTSSSTKTPSSSSSNTPSKSSSNTSSKPPSKASLKTTSKAKLNENPIITAIREISIPTLAKTFNKTPAAIRAWVTNKRIPWPHLAKVSDMTSVPLTVLMDANSEAPKQKFRGKHRPTAMLEDFAAAEKIDDALLSSLAETYGVEKRILKGQATLRANDPKRFKLEYEVLSYVNQQWTTKQEQKKAQELACAKLNVQLHEVNRRLRFWSFARVPTLATLERQERKARTLANRQRLPLAIRAYIRGLPVDEAAIAGHTSVDYLYREARRVMDLFGESPRNLRSLPTFMRYALAEDFMALYEGGTSYAAPLLALYRKTPQTKPRRYAATLKDGFVDLLPGAIASQFTIDEIAEAKETPATVITQRFTDLLLPIGLTWHAIEQMSDYHRDAFYQLLLMKPPE